MFCVDAVLNNRLQNQRLFSCGVVRAESRLRWGMELACCGLGCQPFIYDSHKQFSKRGGDRYASVVFWVMCWPFAFVQWNYFCMSPCGWWELVYRAFVQKFCQALNSWWPHVLEDPEGHLAQPRTLVRFKVVLENCSKFRWGYV